MILAGLGADVIKIERPGSGDEARDMAPAIRRLGRIFRRDQPGQAIRGHRSRQARRRRSHAAHRGEVRRIRREFPRRKSRGDGARRNCGAGRAAGHHLRIVVRIRPARARLSKARLRCAGAGAHRDSKRHRRSGNSGRALPASPMLDMGAGMWVAMGVMAGLFERERTGTGTRVDGSLYQTGIQWMAYHLVARQMTGADPQAARNPHRGFRSLWRFRNGRLAHSDRDLEQPAVRAFVRGDRAVGIGARCAVRDESGPRSASRNSGCGANNVLGASHNVGMAGRFSIAQAFPQAPFNRRPSSRTIRSSQRSDR